MDDAPESASKKPKTVDEDDPMGVEEKKPQFQKTAPDPLKWLD